MNHFVEIVATAFAFIMLPCGDDIFKAFASKFFFENLPHNQREDIVRWISSEISVVEKEWIFAFNKQWGSS